VLVESTDFFLVHVLLKHCLLVSVTAAKAAMRIINVGSGLGGPARYLAGHYGCQVLAVELQDELHRTAAELTERCRLGDQVTHVAGDFLAVARHLSPGSYDAVVSWYELIEWLPVVPSVTRHIVMLTFVLQ
jgi:cyclopropane fatty-acyl-phospholipid synthase-like methyltransferase